jgi:hypothetical protein
MRASALDQKALHLRGRIAGLKCEASLSRMRWLLRKYDPDQPRVSAGNPDGGQWTNAGGSSGSTTAESQGEEPRPQSIINRARRLNLAIQSDGYERCLDLCYPLLERPQRPGSNRNTWDFHRCMDACLKRNLQ